MKLFLLIFLFTFKVWAQLPTPSTTAPVPSPTVLQTPAPAGVPKPFSPSPEVGPWEAPPILKTIMGTAYSVPVVGPIVVELMKWLGVLASILTALVTAFFAIARALSVSFKLLKLVDLAVKVDAFYVKWSPYLKFFSMYNVQKDELKKT